MSFGGFGNSTSTPSFGGFGASNTNTTPAFGSNNTASTAGGSLFGGGNTATSGGFGGTLANINASSPSGAKTNAGFGSTPAASTGGGGLFGNGTSTSGGFGASTGGFGSTNTAATGTGFGATNNTNTVGFGQNKTGFGASNTTGGSIFGGGAATNTTGGFGANNATSNPFGTAATNTNTGFGASNTNTFGGFGASNTSAATSNNGTAGTPFQAFTEKDGATNQTSHYQSITFQQPYQNKSFEELRVEDYLQGRRYGNSNGQAGSFGASTGFGGSTFGNNTAASTGGSMFGGNTATTNTNTSFGGFGSNNTQQPAAAGGFGASNTGGGIFGSTQPKPATGGLFGNTSSSGATTGGFGSTVGGSIFGGTSNTTSGFGGGLNTASNTGGGLFGNNNNQNAPKPAFGGFGASGTNTGSGFGASNTNTGGGGLFGSSTNTNSFGGAQSAQQNTTNTGFGGAFGNNQPKPATTSLFGGSNTTNTGGLFGSANNNNQQQQQNTGGGLFGGLSSSNNNTAGGGLFGNNQAKPATSSIFGGGSTSNTGGGLFGSTNNNQQSTFGGGNSTGGGSLFQQQPKPGGLFGSSTNVAPGGSSLFGSNNNQQSNAGASLFGSTNQTQNNSSLFGTNQGTNNQNQPSQLHASLTLSPYGNDQLFSSLGQSSTPVGPLATPLVGARPTPARTPSLLSSTRLNSPIYTPRASVGGRNPGYGFSYSTYGTPSSAFSVNLTPQASSLLRPTGSLGSALTSRLAKSMSMNNLRGTDTPTRDGDSLLRPTPGSASSRYLNASNMRKLTIDRNLRTDLFSAPETKQVEALRAQESISPGLHKKVSFDSAAAGAKSSNTEPSANNALVRTETSDGENAPQARTNTPEMQQVNGASSLAGIPEDTVPQRPVSAPTTKRPAEKTTQAKEIAIGDYWTKPAIKDLKNMSRTQLSKLGSFTVGRDGVGRIQFGPCDLTSVDLERLLPKNDEDNSAIVQLKLRSATVYPEEAIKPPRGKGLNVPSDIWLENSWPRMSHGGKNPNLVKSGPAFDRHVARFKKMAGTHFKDYDAETGIWHFSVDHFTTYGLDDDDNSLYTEEMEDVQQDSSGLSDAPATPPLPQDDTLRSMETSNSTGELDDTFEFKDLKSTNRPMASLQKPHHALPLPGAFDEPQQNIFSDYEDPSADEGMQDEHMMSGSLGYEDDLVAPLGGAVQAPSPGAYERHNSSMVLDESPGVDALAEVPQADHDELEVPGSFVAEEPKLLRSILKPTIKPFASPEKLATATWEEQLQRTMSPKKRDRQALKELQHSILRADVRDEFADSPFKQSMLGQSALGESYLAQKSAKKVGFGGSTVGGKPDLNKSQAFRTSMDLMNSLWSNEKTERRSAGVKGFEKPYSTKSRLSAPNDMDQHDHHSMKPHFASNGTLVYEIQSAAPSVQHPLMPFSRPLVGEHTDVRFAKFASPEDLNTATLSYQKERTTISAIGNFPLARPQSSQIELVNLARDSDGNERAIWQLASLLFDAVQIACRNLTTGMSDEAVTQYEARLRKDAFEVFWSAVVAPFVDDQLAAARSSEEKALLLLTKNDVDGAADVLVKGKNFKIATLVAQLPGTRESHHLMRSQIEAWRTRNDWSEMSDSMRAIYTILTGETCVVQGKNGPKEDRRASFSIANHFGLHWTQSLALHTFFGGHSTIQEAVRTYTINLAEQRDKVLPLPWWALDAAEAQGNEDTLLGLLRIGATTRAEPADLESIFDSKTVSDSSVNSRLAWQLATVLGEKGISDYISAEKLDQLSLAFAAELENANNFVSAAWVLLHLSDTQTRKSAIKDLLMRNAGNIPDPPTAPAGGDMDSEFPTPNNWRFLAEDLKVPGPLLWEAKALHASAELHNPVLQASYLLNAAQYDDAHTVLCNIIGPQAIIEEDYDEVTQLLARFPDSGSDRPDTWVTGGGVYTDFCTLTSLNAQRKQGKEGRLVMERLGRGLEGMGNLPGKKTLEVMVAWVEMSKVLREEVREFGGKYTGGGVESNTGRDDGKWARYQRAMGVAV